jgi:Ni2+-binding GTPase involved in maturation of urease and hydrogenase
VIEGDIASTVDADRVSVLAVPVIQINTAGVCLIPEAFLKTGDNLS